MTFDAVLTKVLVLLQRCPAGEGSPDILPACSVFAV